MFFLSDISFCFSTPASTRCMKNLYTDDFMACQRLVEIFVVLRLCKPKAFTWMKVLKIYYLLQQQKRVVIYCCDLPFLMLNQLRNLTAKFLMIKLLIIQRRII